jgi:hypothetical protein
MCLIGPVFAQSITISPKNPSVAVTKMVQFSAKVTGLTSSDVTWYAGGVQGGSTAAGKISTGGLYTAPASLPGQNPVTVTAKSKSNSSVYGSTYVTILSAGPKITTVAPNPLTVGTVNVTITGTGFKSGATAFISYGSNTNIQMVTKSATSTTLKANGYLGPATKATFVVKNPGSDFSNALVVPVSGASPPTQYTLNVIKGTGSGSYAAGTVVTITANAPPTGQAFLDWTGATVANPNAVSTTLTMPAANTTITANYAVSGTTNFALTVVNGTGSGSYAAGTVVTITANAPPAGQTFLNWTGATVQNANASTTTLTMPSGSTTLTANYTAPSVTIPYPVTTHPRLWVTTSDLPRLQSWATTNNPIYAQGIVPLLNQTLSNYAQFFPNGSPNPNYPDPGDTQGYTGLITEQNAVILAFNSLIDPVPAKRILYAQYARNLLMYAMNQAVLGHLSNAPFRDPAFAIYNRANENGEQWALTVDWIYNTKDGQGNPILTAADKATIRNVFLIWANDCINASTTGGDHPEPIGVTNNLQLLPSNQPYRMAANNYYLGHARILTMMALSIDPSDDPLLNGSAPASQLGNTLRSYILNANGAWLYQEFAMFGDPSVVPPAYGLPANTPGFGLASGGLPPEGMLYGHSIGFILGQLLALQTAGFDNVSYSGPQIQLIGAPFWDRFVTGFLASLTPTAQTFASQSWLGPVYQFGSYGDLLRLWVTPDFMQPFSLLALLEQENGKTTHTPAARWMAVNGVEGGANALLSRISSPWSYGTTAPLLYYMLLDPTAPAASDPRPTYPTMFYDPAAGRIVAHSDWSATGTLFDYRASWMSINHQDGDGGQFELYRKGEWLTKEMSNYDNNEVGLTTVYHNSLALQIWSANGTPDLSWFENGEWANGSEWILGANAGDPTTITSTGPGYIYATSDLTNLFNRPDFWTPSAGAVDIQQATRSILWLNSDYIVIYDRATSLHSGLFKRFNMSLVTNPTISGKTATETLASGQKLFVQALLPANATLTATYAAGNLNPIAQLEPTQYILTVEDTTKPTDTRFLNVLQGADSGTAMVQATYLKSTSGTAFDGAVFGSTAVYFPVSASSTFATTVLPASSGVHTLLVTGLKPGTAYGVSVTASGGGNIITVTPGIAGMTTDSAGVLRVTF